MLPYSSPSVTNDDLQRVTNTVASGWLASGRIAREFEATIGGIVGAKGCVATSSCTAALCASLWASGVRRGDVVLMPSMTFAGTANAAILLGARIVFADITLDTLSITADLINFAAKTFTVETGTPISAVVPVHYAGQLTQPVEIMSLAEQNGWQLVHDCAHCLESSYRASIYDEWKAVGTLGGACCYSFYPTKCITTGLGGLISSNDESFLNRVRRFCDNGIARESSTCSWDYEVCSEGFNFAMSDMNASLGLSQLSRHLEMHSRRAEIARLYDSAFRDHPLVTPLAIDAATRVTSHHMYVLRLLGSIYCRNDLIKQLRSRGIATSVHWRPLHWHPRYKQLRSEGQCYWSELPNSDAAGSSIISLPCFPDLAQSDAEHVAASVLEVLSSHRAEST